MESFPIASMPSSRIPQHEQEVIRKAAEQSIDIAIWHVASNFHRLQTFSYQNWSVHLGLSSALFYGAHVFEYFRYFRPVSHSFCRRTTENHRTNS
jgi:hypothetical protein